MTRIPSKYLEAQSAEEVAKLLASDDRDVALAGQVWEEICNRRAHEGESLSLDELEAVAGGGVDYRDWYNEGCAATVEPGSDCWFTDGGCESLNISYFAMPGSQSCVLCGARYTFAYDQDPKTRIYACRECRRFFTFKDGQWQETTAPAGLVL